MTSVGVISSAEASIKCLKDLHQNSGSWPNEADEILTKLEETKIWLVDVYRRKTGKEEELKIKEVVRLSYEIVDAIADSFKPSSSIFGHLTRSGGTKLQELHQQLKGFLANDDAIKRKSSGPSTMGEKLKSKFQPKAKKTNKPDITTDSEVIKGDNKAAAAGSESITGPQEMTKSSASSEDKPNQFDLLKSKLLEPPENESREVYIVGESGMGKTTLARKLYDDPDIQNCFDVSCWVTIGHNFQIKEVIQSLLKQLDHLDLREMNEIQLISQIFDLIKNKSYLFVLDGIGAVEEWDSIRVALPPFKSARVIITTSSDKFPRGGNHYRISGLTQPEILALLNNQGNTFDPKVGEAISHISGGSPLYATILGKSLKSQANSQNLVAELYSYIKGTPEVLGACYKRLTPELIKPCFLYLGQFPPCQDIHVDKLHLLLVAENLIIPPEKSKMPSQSLRDYLKTLAGLKLVEVEEDLLSETGLYKTCRLHRQVREFCISQGMNEEFIEIVDFESSKQVVGPYTRRLAIYMAKYRGDRNTALFKGNDTVKKILSLLIFDAFASAVERFGWPSEIKDLSDFTHLRTLSFDEVDFKLRKLPKGIEKLLLLRFLSFRGCKMEELPSYLSNLTQLETLDLLVQDDCCITIPDNIFINMKRMVHLYLPRLYQRTGKGKLTLQVLVLLETLINFNTDIFEVGDLVDLKKLKILSTISNGKNSKEMDAVIDLLNERGEQLRHSSMEIRSLDCYNEACSSALKKLLHCGFVNSVRIEGEIWELPAEDDNSKYGERVVEMVLHGSELDLDLMGYLGKFQNLRRLVLGDDAFLGADILISSSAPFPKLRSLKLRNLQYLETLTIEEGAVPELSSLQIESCGDALQLTIPKVLYHRLKNDIGGDAYSVVPSPSKFITTPLSPTKLDGGKERLTVEAQSSCY